MKKTKKIKLTPEMVSEIQDEGIKAEWNKVLNSGGEITIKMKAKVCKCNCNKTNLIQPMAAKSCQWWEWFCNF